MSIIAKKIEVAANIAILIVAVIIVVVVIQKYFLTQNDRLAPIGSPVGTKISLPQVDWSKNGRSLVLALQSGCRYCTESAPFYQRLAAELSTRKIPLVAVFPQTIDEGQTYLGNLKVPVDTIKQSSLRSIGVQGTPAILLVDNKGEVKALWPGKLSPTKESEVLSSLAQ